jgi:hypothetical protein
MKRFLAAIAGIGLSAASVWAQPGTNAIKPGPPFYKQPVVEYFPTFRGPATNPDGSPAGYWPATNPDGSPVGYGPVTTPDGFPRPAPRYPSPTYLPYGLPDPKPNP